MIGKASTEFLTAESREKAIKSVLPKFYRTGSVYNVEYDFVRKDGKILPVLMSAIAEYNETGEFYRSLAVMFDNSEAKRAQAELVQSQRTDAIGRLVGGVAHDFNNILTVVVGNIEFLLYDLKVDNQEEVLQSAYNAALRGATLTKQLLVYGRKSQLNEQLTDVNVVIREMDQMLRRVLPETIDIETVSAAGLWSISVDRHMLDTSILNIVNNARDAMPKVDGKLTIETCNVRISEEYISDRQEDISPGRYVMLAISDNGEGISKDVQNKVFEPFFTTKDVGKGAGLGLSMVFGYMKQSNGAIRIYSEPENGTTFKLYFPAVNLPALMGTEEQISSEFEQPRTSISALIVEDEMEVRKILVKQIQASGVNIHQAGSGDEALKMLQEGLRPDILLTDIVMPGRLQGPELAVEARNIMPKIRVVFVSGYPHEASIHGNGIGENDALFVKPVETVTLVRTITKMAREIEQSR